MKGANELRLNMASMIEIVQHYFDTVQFKYGQSPKVGIIVSKAETGGTTFLIYLGTPPSTGESK